MDLKILKNGSVTIKVTPEDMKLLDKKLERDDFAKFIPEGYSKHGAASHEIDKMNTCILALVAKSMVVNTETMLFTQPKLDAAKALAMFIKDNFEGLTKEE